jgi:hypothetical protein
MLARNGGYMSDYFGSWERFKENTKNHKKVFEHIEIRVIPIGCMRPQYADGYDYWVDEKGTLQIRVAEFVNPDFAFYWVIHELLEAWRCARDGISLESIEKFDAGHKDHEDPGSLKGAPYHKQHMQSLTIQHLLCEQDGYSYEEHMDAEPIPAKNSLKSNK